MKERLDNSDPNIQNTTVPQQVVQILNRIGIRTGIQAYQRIQLADWSDDLMAAGRRIGFQCLLREAERFEQYFVGQWEAKDPKICRKGRPNPRARFLNQWLGRVFPDRHTTGDSPDLAQPGHDHLNLQTISSE